jgi:hypothetical protein
VRPHGVPTRSGFAVVRCAPADVLAACAIVLASIDRRRAASAASRTRLACAVRTRECRRSGSGEWVILLNHQCLCGSESQPLSFKVRVDGSTRNAELSAGRCWAYGLS